MAAKHEVPLTAKERQLAYDWHGGMGSMLYAAASAGALRLGPQVAGMTSAEQWWDIADRLAREAENTAREAEKRQLRADARGLRAIAGKARRAAVQAKIEVSRQRSDREAFLASGGRGQGYSADEAWAIAMAPGGSRSVIDLEGGGFGVPLEPLELVKPRSGDRMVARVPRGLIDMRYVGHQWRTVGDVRPHGKKTSAHLDREIAAALVSARRRR